MKSLTKAEYAKHHAALAAAGWRIDLALSPNVRVASLWRRGCESFWLTKESA